MRLSQIRGLLRDRPNADPVLLYAALSRREAEQERELTESRGVVLPICGLTPAKELGPELDLVPTERAEREARIRDLWDDGLPDGDIARLVGMARTGVMMVRKRLGLATRYRAEVAR